MRQNITEAPPRGDVRFRRLLLRLADGVSVVLAVLTLFILFEVVIRHVPPDGMSVTDAYGPSLYGSTRTTYTAPQDQQDINTYYAELNAAPVESRATTSYALPDGCYPTAYPNITFTWHGIPLESWSGYCVVVESAGGISETVMGTYHVWEPVDGPLGNTIGGSLNIPDGPTLAPGWR